MAVEVHVRSTMRPALEGAIAQLGERLLCKQEVTGSIPVGSTSLLRIDHAQNLAPSVRAAQ